MDSTHTTPGRLRRQETVDCQSVGSQPYVAIGEEARFTQAPGGNPLNEDRPIRGPRLLDRCEVDGRQEFQTVRGFEAVDQIEQGIETGKLGWKLS